MISKVITYLNYDGEEVEETYLFHLSGPEAIRLELETEGLEKRIRSFVEKEDAKSVMEFFERIIIESYGVKSADGKIFRKSKELAEDFRQSAAYEALFLEILTNEDAAISFFNGVAPKPQSKALRENNNVNRG